MANKARKKKQKEPEHDVAVMLREWIQKTVDGDFGEKGVSLYYISKVSGVPHNVIARFMRGERDIRLQTAAKLFKMFGVKIVTDQK